MLARRCSSFPKPRGLRLNRSALRRSLARHGFTPAEHAPSPSASTWDACAFERVRLLEGTEVRAIPVGDPLAWREPVAFLDGMQRAEVLAYAGTHPICMADVAAAVRVREEGILTTVVELRRTLLLGRRADLAGIQEELPGLEFIALPDDPLVPPLRDIALAAQAVDHARAALEAEAYRRFRVTHHAWLVVDGTLTAHPAWLADPRAIGICRSHVRLPFEGRDLQEYLGLAAGHRSPVFAPPPVDDVPWAAWALRLRAWEGKDLLHGLLRVEVASANGTAAQADWLSRRILAERTPLAGDAAGSDRTLYPLHAVREYLMSRYGAAGAVRRS